jgi:hypothetical protein
MGWKILAFVLAIATIWLWLPLVLLGIVAGAICFAIGYGVLLFLWGLVTLVDP